MVLNLLNSFDWFQLLATGSTTAMKCAWFVQMLLHICGSLQDNFLGMDLLDEIIYNPCDVYYTRPLPLTSFGFQVSLISE